MSWRDSPLPPHLHAHVAVEEERLAPGNGAGPHDGGARVAAQRDHEPRLVERLAQAPLRGKHHRADARERQRQVVPGGV